jgi:cytochrome c oxidase subunit 2
MSGSATGDLTQALVSGVRSGAMAPRLPRALRAGANAVTVALAGSLLLSACELPRFGAPDPASDQGRRIGGLWSGFFLAAAAVALLVWVLLAVVLIRHRRRPGDEDRIPSQRAYNIPIEVIYTAIPVVIVAVLFLFSVSTERKVTAVSKHPAVRVEVVGFQWGWRFRYLDEGFTVDAEPGKPPELVLPLGAPSNLRLVSTDVNHSFWVPNFLSKRDLIPNVRNEITVTPTRTGTFIGRCAEFCGLDHWQMYFTVRVVPERQYEAWARARRHGS